MQFLFDTRRSQNVIRLAGALALLLAILSGCGSKTGGDASAGDSTNDAQKAASVAQQGAAADAANRQARQADEARRAASNQAH